MRKVGSEWRRYLTVGEFDDLCKRACAKLCRAVSFLMKAAVHTNSTSTAVLAMGREARPPARGVRVTDATRAQHLHHHRRRISAHGAF